MATGRISRRTLDALLLAAVDGFLWDEDLRGFGLKTTSHGAASYVVQYRMGGREANTRRYTIGAHGCHSARESRPHTSSRRPRD